MLAANKNPFCNNTIQLTLKDFVPVLDWRVINQKSPKNRIFSMKMTDIFHYQKFRHSAAALALMLVGQVAAAQIAVDPLGMVLSGEGGSGEAYVGALTTELKGAGGSASASMLSPTVPMVYTGSVTGIADTKPYSGDIKVWPNPVTDYLSVKASGGIATATITSMSGQTVLQQTNVSETELKFDVSALPSGNYLIQVQTTDNALFGGKFIKK